MPRRVIVVTGTPGTGKTTLTSVLAARLKAFHVDVPELVEREALYRGVDKRRRAKIVNLPQVRNRIRELAWKESRLLLVSSHVPDVVWRRDVKKVVVLRLDPRELKRRLEDLKWPLQKVRENVASEALGTCFEEAAQYYGEDKLVELDVTGLSIEEAVDRLHLAIKGRIACKVDWLSKAVDEEDLARLLAEL
ncbi:MAG: hypothetical protein DRJ97_08365 [Thermoprotei archaeon]|nr:MAG: hypothetical protein DRJ69_06515 [Thermoprotei archaeon]RLF13311.1 MAG: hypothetical protein DRJ97_08365 [Thermoprotei archaeon]